MTFEKVKEIIMDTINCSEDKITLEANLKDDLGIDSLDSMELMMAVEDAYGITVPEEELPNITSKQLLSMLTRMQLNIKILRKTVCYGY